MIFFGDRQKLNEAYKKWIKENNIADTSFNVITFVSNLLDEKRVKDYLKEKR